MAERRICKLRWVRRGVEKEKFPPPPIWWVKMSKLGKVIRKE
jgi:hypothetical protein